MYTDSLVAFLDILGLTDRIRETANVQSEAQTIADMLEAVQRVVTVINERARDSWKVDFSARAFSDSVVISCPTISRRALIYLAHTIAMLQFDIMRKGFFLRGSVAAGGHYEADGVAFGPALLRAYEMEKRSIWPRVLVDPFIFQKLPSATVEAALGSYVSQDENGLYYFNYLHLLVVQHSLSLEEGGLTEGEISSISLADPLKKHKEYLLAAVRQLPEESRLQLLPKYHAVAAYHNHYVKEVYLDLPTQKDHKGVKPGTATAHILESITTLASSLKGVERNSIDGFLESYIGFLYGDRIKLQECEIDLCSLFSPLYPHVRRSCETGDRIVRSRHRHTE